MRMVWLIMRRQIFFFIPWWFFILRFLFELIELKTKLLNREDMFLNNLLVGIKIKRTSIWFWYSLHCSVVVVMSTAICVFSCAIFSIWLCKYLIWSDSRLPLPVKKRTQFSSSDLSFLVVIFGNNSLDSKIFLTKFYRLTKFIQSWIQWFSFSLCITQLYG